jgi:hypothetical protein
LLPVFPLTKKQVSFCYQKQVSFRHLLIDIEVWVSKVRTRVTARARTRVIARARPRVPARGFAKLEKQVSFRHPLLEVDVEGEKEIERPPKPSGLGPVRKRKLAEKKLKISLTDWAHFGPDCQFFYY